MASLVPFLMVLASLPLLATPQESLGDLARLLRQQQLKAGPKTSKVYTNDNLPSRKLDEGRAAASGGLTTSSATPSDQAKAGLDSLQAGQPTGQEPEPSQAATKSEKPEDKQQTKEYWQARFRSVRARLADAQEREQLAEDELDLLQIQEVRALNANVKTELQGKIKEKDDEVLQTRSVMQEAWKALDDLQKEFRASGAPDEWSVTETGSD